MPSTALDTGNMAVHKQAPAFTKRASEQRKTCATRLSKEDLEFVVFPWALAWASRNKAPVSFRSLAHWFGHLAKPPCPSSASVCSFLK